MSQTALSAQINARIEGLPVVGWQARVRLLLGVITFFEAFDLLLISFTLPLLKQQWQLDPNPGRPDRWQWHLWHVAGRIVRRGAGRPGRAQAGITGGDAPDRVVQCIDCLCQ